MSKAITDSSFEFKGQKSVYNGKVRDVYTLDNGLLVMVASDRISAFDHVLPKGIPHKGQVLNQVATMFLDATKDIVPNFRFDAKKNFSSPLSRNAVTFSSFLSRIINA